MSDTGMSLLIASYAWFATNGGCWVITLSHSGHRPSTARHCTTTVSVPSIPASINYTFDRDSHM